MSKPKRLVLFVEGEGDEKAVPHLAKHLVSQQNGWTHLSLDPDPFRTNGLHELAKGDFLVKKLKSALKRGNVGAILVIVDGDSKKPQFCARNAAQALSVQARTTGAGSVYSLAIVLAVQEYETWLIAGADVLAGLSLPDQRPGIIAGTKRPATVLEEQPRGAKEWLSRHMEAGYKPTVDQEPLTKLLLENLAKTDVTELRSFRRLASAVKQLVDAVKSGVHVCTP